MTALEAAENIINLPMSESVKLPMALFNEAYKFARRDDAKRLHDAAKKFALMRGIMHKHCEICDWE